MKDYKQYIGYTTNLVRRLKEHSNGKCLSTSGRRPFKLIFYEYYYSKTDAIRREKYFKTTEGKKTLKIMLRACYKIL